MNVYTIGFTKKGAEKFFEALKSSDVHRLVDVRLNNVSQLAGFAKRDDLEYFLSKIANIEYLHAPILAPSQEMLDRYKKQGGSWGAYVAEFMDLMRSRRIEDRTNFELKDGDCLLCSEDKPEHCHRRLVLEYVRPQYAGLDILHLG